MRAAVPGLLLSGVFLALAGCVMPPPGANPPLSLQSQGTIPLNHPPESANSLPPGAVITAPFTSVAGQLNSVQLAPLVVAPVPVYPY